MLKKVRYISPVNNRYEYPFNLKWLPSISHLSFNQPLTFLVGSNGVGKSTMLQSLAIQNQIPQLTNESYESDPTYDKLLAFSDCLKTEWSVKSKNGFFFRADDFISFVRKNAQLRNELLHELALLDEKGVPKLSFERQPYENSLAALKRTYPKELHELSHGQSFLALFKSRLTPKSLYLLDEPETPLSSQNQLTLLHMIDAQIKQGAQFIIASHSPILTAHPDAVIYQIDEDRITSISYDEIENVTFMKSFMADPQRFMYYTLENQ